MTSTPSRACGDVTRWRDDADMQAVTVAGRVTTAAGDFLVLFVTWRKTYSSYRAQTVTALNGPSLVRVMLYNGV